MKLHFEIEGDEYVSNLEKGICIAIPLNFDGQNPNCFFAPLPRKTPVKSGEWIGSIKEGGDVNFFNIILNPHGNGTHTECYTHIHEGLTTIHETITTGVYSAQLVSVYPELKENGDRVIDSQACILLEDLKSTDALIIRTLPNDPSKQSRMYSGTNPPYLSPAFVNHVKSKAIKHLLIDLPSIDKEQDDGKLEAHRTFWNTNGEIDRLCTITEMIYVPDHVPDGLYILTLGIGPFHLDVSPSRPMLFEASKKEVI